jgi:hypothetical protein
MKEVCYEVKAENPRVVRELLRNAEGVVSAEPAGTTLHVFLTPDRTSPDKLRDQAGSAEFRQIVPSLEDVFIALVRKAEAQ